jgi:hypothetical protein
MGMNDGRFDAVNHRRKVDKEIKEKRDAFIKEIDAAETVEQLREQMIALVKSLRFYTQ